MLIHKHKIKRQFKLPFFYLVNLPTNHINNKVPTPPAPSTIDPNTLLSIFNINATPTHTILAKIVSIKQIIVKSAVNMTYTPYVAPNP